MLLHLIALGVIPQDEDTETETGTVIATADRTAVLTAVQASTAQGAGIPLGAVPWRQQIDPADHVPYAVDFTALLGADEKIASIAGLSVSAAGALLGVQIDTAVGYRPIIDTAGKKIQVWFLVDAAFWASGAFDASGILVTVTARVLTDAEPPKRFERTTVLSVRQL